MPQRGNFTAGAGYTNYPVSKGFFVFINSITLNVLVFLVCFKCLALYLITLCFYGIYFAAKYIFQRLIKTQRGFSNAGAGYTFYPHSSVMSLIVEGLSPLQQSPLSFAVIIDCSGLRSSRYEIKTRRTSLIFSILQISFARK